ncbi:Myb/SANT-like DNA-binding domain containing protein 4 [Dissostichus eleginoides]|uniref:Myb/SANT-like DNA-binding domain containing protein 4 n=1 Tax=Dissostichus eleginoides TaxID=100907 RepID=A0AAD9CM67_DISEL|nr:Myb/SANT-like DNA-binding domain containing protein 4 [Dissostichus eleginoides]
MDKKGPNCTSAETHALLQSVRNNYDSIVGSFNREGGATKVKSGIWMEVTDNVNATGSGHKRTVDQVVNAPDVTHTIEDEVLLTHVDPEAGPSARPDDTLQEPPRKRKCKRTREPEQRDDAYETLLSRDTERAEIQIRLAEEQIQLCRLQQTETSLRIQLLKARLDDPAAFE